jgi:alpha-1,2-mannosyltransferase
VSSLDQGSQETDPGEPAGTAEHREIFGRRAPYLRALVIGVLAGAAAVALIAPILHASLTNPADRRMIDLAVYRAAGQSILAGREVYATFTHPWHLGFTYPPVAAVLALPLALVSWHYAQLAWVFVVYLCTGVVIWYSFRPLLRQSGQWAPVVFAALVVVCAYLKPVRDEVHFGQVDILLLALCLVDCCARRTRWPPGLLIGFAAAIKLTPAVLIMYLVITRQFRMAKNAVVSMLAWTALGFALEPETSVRYWTNLIFRLNRIGSRASTSNQSLMGLLAHFFAPSAVPIALWLCAAVVVGTVGFAAARRCLLKGSEMAALAITFLIGVLLSPISWFHMLVFVVPALGVITADGRSRARLMIAAALAAVYLLDIPTWGQDLLAASSVPVLLGETLRSVYGIGLLLIVALLASYSDSPGQHLRGSSLKNAASRHPALPGQIRR